MKAARQKGSRSARAEVPVALTIAGSDSGGGAGIQADLKTFAAFDVFGTSAITCVTAQNPDAVTGIEALSARIVERQIQAVFDGFPVAAIKTGMLYSAAVIAAVARALRKGVRAPLVVDPVMVATSGARLLRQDAVRALGERILPLATVVTPNVPEAEILADMTIRTLADAQAAARAIARRFGTCCVVKGGHLPGEAVVDLLSDGHSITAYFGERLAAAETHGTGCTFSAALTASLARGRDLPEAVQKAKDFVAGALRGALRAGRHRPLNFRWNV